VSGHARLTRAATVVAIGGLVALADAPAALAAGGVSVARADGSDAGASTTSANTCFTVVGSVPSSFTGRGNTVSLSVVDPYGTAHPAGSAQVSATADRQIKFQFSTGALSWDDTCNGAGAAPNGSYVASLSNGASVTFRVAVPPVAPTGFTASAEGTSAVFRWQPNPEPDVVAYDVVDASGTDVTPGGVDAGSVCDSSSCSVDVDFGSSAAGTSRTFRVLAWRSTAPGAGTHVAGGPSAPATVEFPAAARPSPSSSGGTPTAAGGGGSTGAGGGRTGGGRHAPGGATGGATGGHRGTGRGRVPVPGTDLRGVLPAQLAGSAPALPSVVTEVKPLPEGTYKPTLAYPDQVTRERVRKPEVAIAQSVTTTLSRALDHGPLLRGLAGAVVLLLLAAHLRAFVARAARFD
jgi:hypothetical protein